MAEVKKVLVYRIGSLGDNLVALPAIRAAKKRFPDARFLLLSNDQVGANHVPGGEIYRGTGLFDGFLTYPVDFSGKGRLLLLFRLLRLVLSLRLQNFDALIYLPPTTRPRRHVKRDMAFFRFAGIKRIYGGIRLTPFPPKVPGQFLPMAQHEADAMLSSLQSSGFPVPPPGQGDMDLSLGDIERRAVEAVLRQMPSDGGRPWVGVGPGSKQPVKVWPGERYREVVRKLIHERDVWPVIFGGGEDRELGESLLNAWGRGYNLAGRLAVRESAMALSRCALYLGNDTGTMHLAAAVKTPCAAVFCSHARPGQWYPYGPGHRVFRTAIDCEACGLVDCVERKKECILAIGVEEVVQGCLELMGNRREGTLAAGAGGKV